MSEDADVRAKRLVRWAVAVLLLGLVVALVPGLAAGEGFVRAVDFRIHLSLPQPGEFVSDGWVEVAGPNEAGGSFSFETTPYSSTKPPPNVTLVQICGTRASTLVRDELSWTAAAAALAIAPLLFAWWRFGNPSFGRTAGVACAVVASLTVCVLVSRMADTSWTFPAGVWWTVPAGGALMAAAFVVAPTPRRRDE